MAQNERRINKSEIMNDNVTFSYLLTPNGDGTYRLEREIVTGAHQWELVTDCMSAGEAIKGFLEHGFVIQPPK